MVEVIDWPCSLMRPLDVSYFIQWTSREAGANLHGVPQIISPDIGVWRVDITIPREFDGQRVKQLEALVSRMRGRYNVANLCICDPYKYGSRVSPRQFPFTDGTWFTDGTGFADPSAGSETLVTVTDVPEGGSVVRLNIEGPPVIPALRIGDMFSVNGFLYRVVVSNFSTGRIEFEPPAREAFPIGTTIQTDPPHFYGRFIDDSQGQRTRQFLKWGEPITLSFVEAFDR